MTDRINELDIPQKNKKLVNEVIEDFNFVEAPKRMNLSTLLKDLDARYSKRESEIFLKRNYKSYTDPDGNVFKDMAIVLLFPHVDYERTVCVLDSCNSQMYKIKYIEPSEKNKDLFALWLCETNFIDDLKK